MADAKRPDLRFNAAAVDTPVSVELKIADKWPGPKLFERLEEQLCGDYLRDARSTRGVFLLIYRGEQSSWVLPNGSRADSLEALVDALQAHWATIASRYPGIDDIKVIGIDLTKRSARAKAAAMRRTEAIAKRAAKKIVKTKSRSGNSR